MSYAIEFWAEGVPASYSRDGARFGRTPPANTIWRGIIALAYRMAAGPTTPHVGPVEVTIEFYGARANCDIDNLGKEVQDALNGIAFEDDRQIRRCTWVIGDWRQQGAKRKGPKKVGALIRLDLYPADEAIRAKALAAREKEKAAKVKKARAQWVRLGQ